MIKANETIDCLQSVFLSQNNTFWTERIDNEHDGHNLESERRERLGRHETAARDSFALVPSCFNCHFL